MRVAQIAPPWFPIPPVGYGGIERVVHDLTEGLLAAGCDVILCAPAGSQTSAQLVPTVSRPVGLNLTEAQKGRHFVEASRAAYREALALGADLIHDHTDYVPRRGFPLPIVRTIHGPATVAAVASYRAMSRRGDRFVAISHRQRDLFLALAAERGSARASTSTSSTSSTTRSTSRRRPSTRRTEKHGYVAFLGRCHWEKSPDGAIRVAQAAGVPLMMALRVTTEERAYFDAVVRPLVLSIKNLAKFVGRGQRPGEGRPDRPRRGGPLPLPLGGAVRPGPGGGGGAGHAGRLAGPRLGAGAGRRRGDGHPLRRRRGDGAGDPAGDGARPGGLPRARRGALRPRPDRPPVPRPLRARPWRSHRRLPNRRRPAASGGLTDPFHPSREVACRAPSRPPIPVPSRGRCSAPRRKRANDHDPSSDQRSVRSCRQRARPIRSSSALASAFWARQKCWKHAWKRPPAEPMSSPGPTRSSISTVAAWSTWSTLRQDAALPCVLSGPRTRHRCPSGFRGTDTG